MKLAEISGDRVVMLLVPGALDNLPEAGTASDIVHASKACICDDPEQELIHAIHIADEQESMCELQGKVRSVAAPSRVVPKSAIDKMTPDCFERGTSGVVDIRTEFLSVIQTARMEVGDGANDGGVELVDISGSGRDESLPLPEPSLFSEYPANGIGSSLTDLIVDGPQLEGLGSTKTLGKLGGFPESGDGPEVIPVMKFVLGAASWSG